jgi:hypothetical protein
VIAGDRRPFGPRFTTPMLVSATLNPTKSPVIALVSIAVAMRDPCADLDPDLEPSPPRLKESEIFC